MDYKITHDLCKCKESIIEIRELWKLDYEQYSIERDKLKTPIVWFFSDDDSHARGFCAECLREIVDQLKFKESLVKPLLAPVTEEEQIDYAYKLMYTLISEKRFDAANMILADMDLNVIPVSVILSYLTATVNKKKEIYNREKFYNRVEEFLLPKYGEIRTGNLLAGLK